MQFTFLGTRYEANSFPIPVFDNQICDKYRGQARTNKNPQKALISQPFPNLKYRGSSTLALSTVGEKIIQLNFLQNLLTQRITHLKHPRRWKAMKVRWKKLLVTSTLWLTTEIWFNVLGIDDLADYSEFICEKHLILLE